MYCFPGWPAQSELFGSLASSRLCEAIGLVSIIGMVGLTVKKLKV